MLPLPLLFVSLEGSRGTLWTLRLATPAGCLSGSLPVGFCSLFWAITLTVFFYLSISRYLFFYFGLLCTWHSHSSKNKNITFVDHSPDPAKLSLLYSASFLKDKVYLIFVCMSAPPVCVYAPHACLVSVEARRGQEQQVLLTSELSLQPLCLFIGTVMFTLGLFF